MALNTSIYEKKKNEMNPKVTFVTHMTRGTFKLVYLIVTNLICGTCLCVYENYIDARVYT